MNEKTALKKLYKITSLKDANIIFGSRRGPSEEAAYFIRRLIASEDLIDQLSSRVLRRLSDLAEHARPEELREYDAGYTADEDEPRFIVIREDDVIQGVYESITENTANIEPFKRTERGNGRLSYYCLAGYDTQGEEVRFYRGMTPGKQLKPTDRVQAFLRGDKFVAADESPLVFDPNFIGAAYRGFLFIFGTGGFETLFHYYDELKAHAEETLSQIHETNVEIHDFQKLKDVVLANKTNIKRLRGIVKRGHLDKYTVDSMKDTISKFKLSVKVTKTHDGRPKLHWHEGQEKEVLRLLDDYYLTSSTSNTQYGANSKEPWEPGT